MGDDLIYTAEGFGVQRIFVKLEVDDKTYYRLSVNGIYLIILGAKIFKVEIFDSAFPFTGRVPIPIGRAAIGRTIVPVTIGIIHSVSSPPVTGRPITISAA